jgi:MinD superfamily P-loop ATPase
MKIFAFVSGKGGVGKTTLGFETNGNSEGSDGSGDCSA